MKSGAFGVAALGCLVAGLGTACHSAAAPAVAEVGSIGRPRTSSAQPTFLEPAPEPPPALQQGPSARSPWLTTASGLSFCAEQRPELARTRLTVGARVPLRAEERAFLGHWLLVIGPELSDQSSRCPDAIACFDVGAERVRVALDQLTQGLTQPVAAGLEKARSLTLERLRQVEAHERPDLDLLAALVAEMPLEPRAPWGSFFFGSLPNDQLRKLVAGWSQNLTFTVSGPRAGEQVASQRGTTPLGAAPSAEKATPSPLAGGPASTSEPRLFWLDVDTDEKARAWLDFHASPSDALLAALEIVALRVGPRAQRINVRIERHRTALVLSGPAAALPSVIEQVQREAHGLLDGHGAPTVAELRRAAPPTACTRPTLEPRDLQRAISRAEQRTVLIGAQEALEGAFGPDRPLTLVDPKMHRLLAAPASVPAAPRAEESPDY